MKSKDTWQAYLERAPREQAAKNKFGIRLLLAVIKVCRETELVIYRAVEPGVYFHFHGQFYQYIAAAEYFGGAVDMVNSRANIIIQPAGKIKRAIEADASPYIIIAKALISGCFIRGVAAAKTAVYILAAERHQAHVHRAAYITACKPYR